MLSGNRTQDFLHQGNALTDCAILAPEEKVVVWHLQTADGRQQTKSAFTLWNVSCNLSRNVLATLWQDKLHGTFHSVAYRATAKIAARQVARAVVESRINLYFSCNLSRNDFGRCRVWHSEMFRAICPPKMSPKHRETSCTKHFTV